LIAEAFTPRLRYSGASIGYQLASIIAGGPAPFISNLAIRILSFNGSDLHLRRHLCGDQHRFDFAAHRLHEQGDLDGGPIRQSVRTNLGRKLVADDGGRRQGRTYTTC
jgi:hypothetical protein